MRWLPLLLCTTGCWVTDAELVEWAGDTGSAGGASGGGATGALALGDAVGLAVTSPHGLAFHGGELWVGDWATSQLYTVDPSTGDVTARVDLLGENPVGLTSSGDYLWATTTDGGLLEIDTRPGTFTTHQGDSSWSGLAFDGTYVVANSDGEDFHFIRVDSADSQYSVGFDGSDGPILFGPDGSLVLASASSGTLSLTAFDAAGSNTAPELGGGTVGGLSSTNVTGFAADYASVSTVWVVGEDGLSESTLTVVDLTDPPW